MTTQPIPSDVDIENLDESYILVPYGLQFPDENQPLPVGCIIGNKNTNVIQGYMMGANGKWSELESYEITEPSSLFGRTSDNIYQSVIGVAGPEWNKLHSIKERLSEYISSVNPSVESELVEIAIENDSDTLQPQFCSCKSPVTFSDKIISFKDQFITGTVCRRCGKLCEINGKVSGKKKFNITTFNDITHINTIEEDMDAENITLGKEDRFIYTQTEPKVNSITGIASSLWWQSQKSNHQSRPYILTDNNMTLFCNDDLIQGGFIWSYLFGGLICIHHIGLFEELSTEEIEEYLSLFSTNQEDPLHLDKPYIDTPFDDYMTPLEFASGSIQLEEKDN